MSRDPRPGEVYLEFRAVGQQVKVTAIDAATGVEVSTFGPVSASQADLKRIAVRKLQRRLEQEAAARADRGDPTLY
ncbi:serine hydroxymethyltransferase [Rhodobacterales bacterium]|nr:serine hydroxymethyltransferase [Rhodobacterales bacterium]